MLNSVVWSGNILNKKKSPIYHVSVLSSLLCGAETWTLNTQQANELLPNEMDIWSRSVRKLGEEKTRNDTVSATMHVGKNIRQVTEEKRLKLLIRANTKSGKRLPRRILEWEHEGKTQRKPDCWMKQGLLNNLGLTEEILDAGTCGEINFGWRKTTAQGTNPWINEWKDIRMWIQLTQFSGRHF